MDSFTSMDVLGLFAGTLTTIAFVPQLIKVWRSKSAQDISYGMFTLFVTGIVLWEIYGWGIHSFPVILFNVITFVLGSAILVLKVIFDSKAPAESCYLLFFPVTLSEISQALLGVHSFFNSNMYFHVQTFLN